MNELQEKNSRFKSLSRARPSFVAPLPRIPILSCFCTSQYISIEQREECVSLQALAPMEKERERCCRAKSAVRGRRSAESIRWSLREVERSLQAREKNRRGVKACLPHTTRSIDSSPGHSLIVELPSKQRLEGTRRSALGLLRNDRTGRRPAQASVSFCLFLNIGQRWCEGAGCTIDTTTRSLG